jgi:hypothetical protein
MRVLDAFFCNGFDIINSVWSSGNEQGGRCSMTSRLEAFHAVRRLTSEVKYITRCIHCVFYHTYTLLHAFDVCMWHQSCPITRHLDIPAASTKSSRPITAREGQSISRGQWLAIAQHTAETSSSQCQ